MKGEGAKISSSSSSCELELPAGFRFHPTDDELVMHYLCRKCASLSISVPIITDIDLYKYDPWVLPNLANYGEKEWYFFTPRDRKYPNGSRPNRSAGSGYWKATGADRPIGVPKTVGIKKALVFYQGKAPKGTKTNWIMHEYRLADVDRSAHNDNHSTKNSKLDEWVLCRLYHKKGLIDRQLTHTSDHNKSSTKPIKTTSSGEQKSEVLAHCQQSNIMPSPIYMNSYPRFEQPDLVFQTDQSCCSEHVTTSSSSTWEREVQSEPRMKVEDNSWLEITQLNRDMDQFENELSPLEDMFMYLKKKPF